LGGGGRGKVSKGTRCAQAGAPPAASVAALPLCTQMGEGRALGALFENLSALVTSRAAAAAAGKGRGGVAAGKGLGGSRHRQVGRIGAGAVGGGDAAQLMLDEDGEVFLESLEPWMSVGALSACRVMAGAGF